MTTEELIAKVYGLIEPMTDDTDMFVVSIKVKPTANIKVYLDADSGLTVEKCMKVNRALRAAIDAEGWFPEGDYSIEISSPGVDEPLSGMRQYRKNIGRLLEITKTDSSTIFGTLRDITDAELTLEVKIPKKKETRTEIIPFNDIKTAVVQVVF